VVIRDWRHLSLTWLRLQTTTQGFNHFDMYPILKI
jgi:hypothetical protein